MKSQFLAAFNEVCREKNLPSETVLEALKNALVSAYRRDNAVSNAQLVTADIDPRTGELAVFAEKEVVEEVLDGRTEVTLAEANRYQAGAQLGDLVMADSTPRNFGRIAAQTAKQVILQRVREAERDHLFEEFSGREGEIVNGTVQGIAQGNITIGLGRTEATLPRSQQVQGERYKTHEKIRVFVLEVRRTTRGPSIIVSRSHRNLLRRLLELEVPEIYSGQVDIKSIAREAGQRAKVAVKAMQPGVDPVGACVGMRGVRIQSIVRELNDEKIDVIEWDIDPRTFIAKALSPARVNLVFLDDDPEQGRTATVIVSDDQLSLAIGREGQNARLAAKLTGWRIDIKSLTEAGRDSLNLINHPSADSAVARDQKLLDAVRDVIAKKEQNRPITAEDYANLNRLVIGVEGRIIGSRTHQHNDTRRKLGAARARVPLAFWSLDLEELRLPMSIHNTLANRFEKVGELMYQVELGGQELFKHPNFTDEMLEKIRAKLAGLLREYGDELPDEIELDAHDLLEELPMMLDDEGEDDRTIKVDTLIDTSDDELMKAVMELGAPMDVKIAPEPLPDLADILAVDPSLIDNAWFAAEKEDEPHPEEVVSMGSANEDATEVDDELDDLQSLLDNLDTSLVESEPATSPRSSIRVVRNTPRDESEDRRPQPNKKGGKPAKKKSGKGGPVDNSTRKPKRKGYNDWDEFDY